MNRGQKIKDKHFKAFADLLMVTILRRKDNWNLENAYSVSLKTSSFLKNKSIWQNSQYVSKIFHAKVFKGNILSKKNY